KGTRARRSDGPRAGKVPTADESSSALATWYTRRRMPPFLVLGSFGEIPPARRAGRAEAPGSGSTSGLHGRRAFPVLVQPEDLAGLIEPIGGYEKRHAPAGRARETRSEDPDLRTLHQHRDPGGFQRRPVHIRLPGSRVTADLYPPRCVAHWTLPMVRPNTVAPASRTAWIRAGPGSTLPALSLPRRAHPLAPDPLTPPPARAARCARGAADCARGSVGRSVLR